MTAQILGLDIGGANLKAAHTDGSARSVAFPLWKNPQGLTAELQRLVESMPRHVRLAVTMTGELCDCFASKREGVRAIVQSVRGMAGKTPIRIWSTRGRFVSCEDASVAAANWLALAHLVGRRFAGERVLLIDTGSTTTDIVYINHGVPEPRGLTDLERLESGELVYTGARRTPICAVLGMEVAAEFFATMLDAYLLLGMIPDNPTDCDTADGRPATRAFAHARMARMRCADAETFPEAKARALAEHASSVQQVALYDAIGRVVKDKPMAERVVVSGSGEFLGRSVTPHLGWSKVPVTSLADLLGPALSESACAYAVAMLARDEPEMP